jgi:hypothetical protein
MLGDVQAQHVGGLQQFVQRSHLPRVAQRQLGLDVVEQHPHAQLFGQHADLRADVPVADDAQRLAAHLEGAGGALAPAAAVQQRVLLRDAAHQHHDLGQHQFGHAAGVGERRVEDGTAAPHRGLQVDLVGADAERTDGHQLGRGFQHRFGQLRARADAEEMRVGHGLRQRFTGQRLGVRHDVRVAVLPQHVQCGFVDAFEQHELQFVLGDG